jgi:hypothetical protein
MRLRACLLVATSFGAGGALLLAADLYRRLQVAENLLRLNARPVANEFPVFFGMVHVLGLVALALLFLALFLLTSSWGRAPASMPPVTSPPATPQPEQALEVVPDDDNTPSAKP